ncbi:MAG: ECF-type sigma factor [Bacteroidota bacterium]
MSVSAETTALLVRAKGGDADAQNALFGQVYDELKRLARSRRRASRDVTVSTTGLVHEAYLKMAGADGSWENRRHFMRIAAGAMRQVLVDRARARVALKRGGDARMATLDEGVVGSDDSAALVLEVNDALDRLATRDADLAGVVELRFFGGLEVDEVAEVLGVSPRTAARRWALAKALLRVDLT